MRSLVRAVGEAVILLPLLLFAAAAANTLREDGIEWTRDYFLVSEGGTATPSERAGSEPLDAQRRLELEGIAVVSFEEVARLVDDPLYEAGAWLLVDARNEESFESGHIPGAVRFDPYRPERTAQEVVPLAMTAERVVIYCYGGECTDSELAYRHLVGFGVDPARLAVFAGGIEEWCRRGRPVERGASGSGEIGPCEG